jgi:peptidoglycan/xylan/chitin deacetylase (PgdA/CDA1 family)
MFLRESHPQSMVVNSIDHSILNEKQVFLTFDDGPDPSFTPQVLDLLKKHHVSATFFFIAEKAQRNINLLTRVINEGHSIGNHSLDHQTSTFFKSKHFIKKWIIQSDELFNELGVEPVGFRSPLGLNTPTFNQCLFEMEKPLVLWNHRFYDTLFNINDKKINQVVKHITNGSIILLHDTQPEKRQEKFLSQLEVLILKIKKNDYSFRPLVKSEIKQSYLNAK